MRGAGVHDQHVHVRWKGRTSVTLPDGDPRPGRERGSRARRERVIHLDCGHVTGRTGELGDERTVVARPASDVQRAIARTNPEVVEPRRDQSRLAVVEIPGCVERHRDVLVDVPGIGVRGRARGAIPFAANEPWARTEKPLTRDTRECVHERVGCEARRRAQLVGEPSPLGLEIHHDWSELGFID